MNFAQKPPKLRSKVQARRVRAKVTTMFVNPIRRGAKNAAPQDDLKAVRKAARATIFWSRVRPDFLQNESDAAQVQHAQNLLRDGVFGTDDAQEKAAIEATLMEISGGVREAFAAPRVLAREENEARRAFSPIHAQLMETIENQSARPQKKPSRVLATRPRFRLKLFPMQLALASLLLCAATFGGHFLGSKSAPRELPVQSLVDDFDEDLRNGTPLEFIADMTETPRQSAQLLSENVGLKVDAPPQKLGVKLLGARRHSLWNRPGVQAHYMKNGVPFALYQIRETRCALGGLGEVEVNGRTYLAGQRGNYHVVVWRAGDEIVTMVSPLLPRASLDLARVMRENSATT